MNQNSFKEALADLDITLSKEQEEQLEKYYQLLIQYNRVMNLTGITEKEEAYLKHFYDSLTIVKAIDLNKDLKLCDIGTGAGFPGIVLKIVFPNLKITLVDSLQKRINFLNEVITQLHLTDIEAIHSRIEEYGIISREIFDVVTARALAATNILLEYATPLVKVGGYFIPLKGKIDQEPSYEHAAKVLNMQLVDEQNFLLPIENSTRTILKFQKKSITNKKYPRAFSQIKKQPL